MSDAGPPPDLGVVDILPKEVPSRDAAMARLREALTAALLVRPRGDAHV
jgi:hypothetical protein